MRVSCVRFYLSACALFLFHKNHNNFVNTIISHISTSVAAYAESVETVSLCLPRIMHKDLFSNPFTQQQWLRLRACRYSSQKNIRSDTLHIHTYPKSCIQRIAYSFMPHHQLQRSRENNGTSIQEKEKSLLLQPTTSLPRG